MASAPEPALGGGYAGCLLLCFTLHSHGSVAPFLDQSYTFKRGRQEEQTYSGELIGGPRKKKQKNTLI